MRLFRLQALTLTELLVAITLLGIVMLAVASLDVAMRQAYQTTSKDADVSMRVAAAMLHITNNTAVATGMQSDPGIVPDVDVPANTTDLYLRRDGGNPSTYTDDTWMCYHYDAGTPTQDIIVCPSIPSTPIPGPNCTAVCPDKYVLLRGVETFDVLFEPDEVERDLYLIVTIRARYDITAPGDIIDNPSLTLGSRILPLQHTW